jgi:acetyl-CoA acetyltransferase
MCGIAGLVEKKAANLERAVLEDMSLKIAHRGPDGAGLQVFEAEKSKINVLGGNLSYGHPFGASGAINLIHLIASLKYKKQKYGLAVIPAAGGQATAVLIENI